MPSRQGCPATGQVRARVPAQGAAWSPRSTVGTPHGRHASAGTTGANRETTGVPTAAARWAGPVLPDTTHAADASTAASAPNDVRPERSRAPGVLATAAAAVAASAGVPVPPPPQPPSARAATTRPTCGGDGARAGTDAEGCTTT